MWKQEKLLTWNPVDGGGDTVGITGLQRVDNAENLGGVTASRGRVGEDETDGLLWVDDEDGSDSECDTLRIDVGGVLVVKPIKI